jgi:hypothetical protein
MAISRSVAAQRPSNSIRTYHLTFLTFLLLQQLYVQTLRASPLADSPSYLTYRKAVLQAQAAAPYGQPRNPSNLGQASSTYQHLAPYQYPQLYPPDPQTTNAPAMQPSLAPGTYVPKPSSLSAIRPPSQGLGEGQTSPPELDWRTGRLEMWRRGVVSTPVSEEES